MSDAGDVSIDFHPWTRRDRKLAILLVAIALKGRGHRGCVVANSSPDEMLTKIQCQSSRYSPDIRSVRSDCKNKAKVE